MYKEGKNEVNRQNLVSAEWSIIPQMAIACAYVLKKEAIIAELIIVVFLDLLYIGGSFFFGELVDLALVYIGFTV